MSETIIRQTVTVNATPHEVYETIIDSRKHTKLTSDTAVMSRKVGGRTSAFGGYATGKTVELIPDEKIVQTWRASDWPEGVDSTVTYAFKAVSSGTKLAFTHRHVPPEQVEQIKQGWIDFYWTPLKAMFPPSPKSRTAMPKAR